MRVEENQSSGQRVLTRRSNAAGTKRHFESPEDSTPPEAQAPAYQSSGSQYGYGAPAVKRQRSDVEYNNPYAHLPRYQDNIPRYYNATPNGHPYGAQVQAYPQTQTMLGVGAMAVQESPQSAHGQYNMQGAVQASHMPVALPATTGNWTGAFSHGPLSAPAGSSNDSAYGSHNLSARPNYYDEWPQHPHSDVAYGTQTHAAPYYHTPNSMTAEAPQNGTYLPSNVGHGAVAPHQGMTDSSLGEQTNLHGGHDQMWPPDRPASTQPIQLTLPAIASLATPSGAYYQQQSYQDTSKYPDPSIAATSMSNPYQFAPAASPLHTLHRSTLQDGTLNSEYTAQAYRAQ